MEHEIAIRGHRSFHWFLCRVDWQGITGTVAFGLPRAPLTALAYSTDMDFVVFQWHIDIVQFEARHRYFELMNFLSTRSLDHLKIWLNWSFDTHTSKMGSSLESWHWKEMVISNKLLETQHSLLTSRSGKSTRKKVWEGRNTRVIGAFRLIHVGNVPEDNRHWTVIAEWATNTSTNHTSLPILALNIGKHGSTGNPPFYTESVIPFLSSPRQHILISSHN